MGPPAHRSGGVVVGRTRNVVICSVMGINGDEKSREIGVPKEFVTRSFRASSLARQWSFSIISWVSLIFEMDLVKNGKVENILYARLAWIAERQFISATKDHLSNELKILNCYKWLSFISLIVSMKNARTGPWGQPASNSSSYHIARGNSWSLNIKRRQISQAGELIQIYCHKRSVISGERLTIWWWWWWWWSSGLTLFRWNAPSARLTFS